MNDDDKGVVPLIGSLIVDFGENESIAEIDLETKEISEIPLVSQCPN